MVVENGKPIKCPVCGSERVNYVPSFDYWIMCENDECPFYIKHPQHKRYTFMT